MDRTLSIGTSGLALSDIGLRLYADTMRIEAPSNVTFTEITDSGGSYNLSGLPQNPDITYTITYEYPPGVYFSDRWKGSYPFPNVPTFFIIPSRIPDLESELLSSTILLKNGVRQSTVLSIVELGTIDEPGDYLVFGWEDPDFQDKYRLQWTIEGIIYYFDWVGLYKQPEIETRYIEILAIQEPFPFNIDSSDRVMFSCNFSVLCTPTNKPDSDFVTILSNAGLITPNVDTFIGPKKEIPEGDGPFITVVNTGGSSSLFTHDGEKTQRPSVQIVTRATDYEAARDKAMLIYNYLDGIHELTVG